MLSPVGPHSSPLAQRAHKAFTNAYLFSRAETIYAGTTEVQLDVIAQRVMNLPKDLT
jgi:alkylation response protein AidB-like acyl-CoA dehydrogenase